jgi:hypothetical protein
MNRTINLAAVIAGLALIVPVELARAMRAGTV